MSKALRKKRVMIDWSQNSQSKTTVSVYAMRAKHEEPFISMPLQWGEVKKACTRQNRDELFFTPAEALRRLKKKGDLFAPVLALKQRLPDAFQQLGSRSATRASLSRYAAKRDFTRTKEPSAGAAVEANSGTRQRFVIQKHAASHLHYDFRLEMDGTLKSWAVPKGPPYELGVKRAAFEVEDHPVDYMNFEGTIPKGQYGGGTVMVWDIGTYELLGGSHAKGDLKLRLHGKKLKGEWHIFRIRADEGKPLWLLAKSGVAAKPMTARQDDASVLTRRSMSRIASDNDVQWQSNRSNAADTAATPLAPARRAKKNAPATRGARRTLPKRRRAKSAPKQ